MQTIFKIIILFTSLFLSNKSTILKNKLRLLSGSTTEKKMKYQYFIQLVSFIGDEIEDNKIVENDGKGPYSFCLIKFLVKSEEFKKKTHSNNYVEDSSLPQTDFIFIKKLTNGGLCEIWNIKVPEVEGEEASISVDNEQKTINFDSDKYYSMIIEEKTKSVNFA